MKQNANFKTKYLVRLLTLFAPPPLQHWKQSTHCPAYWQRMQLINLGILFLLSIIVILYYSYFCNPSPFLHTLTPEDTDKSIEIIIIKVIIQYHYSINCFYHIILPLNHEFPSPETTQPSLITPGKLKLFYF